MKLAVVLEGGVQIFFGRDELSIWNVIVGDLGATEGRRDSVEACKRLVSAYNDQMEEQVVAILDLERNKVVYGELLEVYDCDKDERGYLKEEED